MTEPSKEAWALAQQVGWPHLAGQDITWLAAALQKLMDERDEAIGGRELNRLALKHAQQRAEAAEKELEAVRFMRDCAEQDVSAAEKKLDALLGELMEWAAEERASFRRGSQGSLGTAVVCDELVAKYGQPKQNPEPQGS